MTLAKLIKSRDVKGDTNYDVILRAWLSHKVEELPDDLKNMVERWQFADAALRNCVQVEDPDTKKNKTTVWTHGGIVEFMVEKFKISTRTAWEDISNSKRFFLSCETRQDKEFARGVMIEWGKKMMWRAFDNNDFKGAAAFYKELNAIQGLHEQSADIPDYAEFQPPNFVIVAKAEELGFEPIEDKEAIVKRILGESRRDFIEAEAVDAEELDDE